MDRYRKGYVAELSLVHALSERGYMTIRAPRSGRINLASPDVIAVKDGKIIVIECKSRKCAFKVPQEQLDELSEWEKKGGAKAYVGWKISRQGWKFINLLNVIENNGNINFKLVTQRSISIEELTC